MRAELQLDADAEGGPAAVVAATTVIRERRKLEERWRREADVDQFAGVGITGGYAVRSLPGRGRYVPVAVDLTSG